VRGSVEHVQRLAHAALDLEHPSERKGDRDLSGRVASGIEGRLEISCRLRVSRIGFCEAEVEEDVGAKRLGRRLRQRPPQIGGG
jgi:hypothetical protein